MTLVALIMAIRRAAHHKSCCIMVVAQIAPQVLNLWCFIFTRGISDNTTSLQPRKLMVLMTMREGTHDTVTRLRPAGPLESA
jgi:hypothetical protein